MGFLSNIFNKNIMNNAGPTDDFWYLPTMGKVKSGADVTHQTALSYSAVWSAISFISQTIASLPYHIYKEDQSGKAKASKYPTYQIIHKQPNPWMPAMTFWETIIGHMVSWGNGYAEKQFDRSGNITALWPIPPNRIRLVKHENKMLYEMTIDGKPVYLDRRNILHIPGMGFDGFNGYSVITMARESIGLGMAAEEFGSRFFGQGAQPGMVVSHPGKLGDTGFKNLQHSLSEKYEGLGHAHRLMLLDEGMKMEKVGLPQKDSQYLETRVFQIEEIARWFNLPPHILKNLDKATFSNIESQAQELVKYCLRHWMVRIEQHCDIQLLPAAARKTYYHKWNAEGLLRGDSKARAEFYKSLWNVGAISINEIRAKEDLNPVEGGDTHFVPLNTVPLETAINQSVETAGVPPGETENEED